MLLCLDVGNSHIYGGVFSNDEILLRFRHTSKSATSDELGIFLKAVLRENDCAPESIKKIAICSVVPQLDYSLRSACLKYFSVDPFFLMAGVKTGLNIRYRNPNNQQETWTGRGKQPRWLAAAIASGTGEFRQP